MNEFIIKAKDIGEFLTPWKPIWVGDLQTSRKLIFVTFSARIGFISGENGTKRMLNAFQRMLLMILTF